MIRNFLRLPGQLCLDAKARCELLERLLARAGTPGDLPDWRAAAFRCLSEEAPPPAAPVARAAAEPGAQVAPVSEFPFVWLATPVHLEPGLDNVRLPKEGLVRLRCEEAAQLAQDFGRLWADAPVRLEALAGKLYLLCRKAASAETHDPESLVGEHIDEFLPQGAGASMIKALMSEIEMWLFEHAVNRERTRSGEPTVTGLWLWGGGPRAALPATSFDAAGDDALFGALRPAGRTIRVVVASHAPGSTAWNASEEPWLRASLKALKADATLAISIKRRCYVINPRWRWRWFRKSRAWWEYFE